MATQKAKAKSMLAELGSNLDDDGPGIETAPEEKRVRIQLEENDNIGPGGQFIGVQGRGYLLQPGVPADVPMGVIHVLDTMVMSTPTLDSQQSITGYRDRLRFPYRVLGPAGDRA